VVGGEAELVGADFDQFNQMRTRRLFSFLRLRLGATTVQEKTGAKTR
jgi:hypothetical protein